MFFHVCESRGTAQEPQRFAKNKPRDTITPPAALHRTSTQSARLEGLRIAPRYHLSTISANLGSQNNFLAIVINHWIDRQQVPTISNRQKA
jgi:hypothetical protein